MITAISAFLKQCANQVVAELGKEPFRRLADDISHRQMEHHQEQMNHVVQVALMPFLQAVADQRYSDALAMCTRELRNIMQEKGAAAELAVLRAHLTGGAQIADESAKFNFWETGCHLEGHAVYAAGRSGPFSIEMTKGPGEWQVSEYLFPAVPAPVPPNRAGVAPQKDGSCPPVYPIKAGRSGVYHVPGGRFYERTMPVRCFASAADAKAAGYSPSRRG